MRGDWERGKIKCDKTKYRALVPLRAFVREIISSSQPPIMCQPKSVPSFVSHQLPIHRPPSLRKRSVPWQEAVRG